jgi:hypothetical protein
MSISHEFYNVPSFCTLKNDVYVKINEIYTNKFTTSFFFIYDYISNPGSQEHYV